VALWNFVQKNIMAIKGSKYQSLEVLEDGYIRCNKRDINKDTIFLNSSMKTWFIFKFI
jgi:hypothetical protein